MRVRVFVAAAALLLSVGGARSEAVTLRDVAKLTDAGLDPQVLIALIEVNDLVYELDAERLLELNRAGVDDRVLVALIRSGRRVAQVQVATIAPPDAESPPPLVIGRRRETVDRSRPGATVPARSPSTSSVTIQRQSTLVSIPFVVSAGGQSRQVPPDVSQDPRDFNSFAPTFGAAARGHDAGSGTRYWGWGGRLRPGAWGRPRSMSRAGSTEAVDR